MAQKKRFKPVNYNLATNDQIAEWKREVNSMEKMLSGKEIDSGVFGYTKALQDPALIQKEINKKKGMIDRLSPHKLTGTKANTALKRAKELKENIQKYMPSQKSYFQTEHPKTGSRTSRQL